MKMNGIGKAGAIINIVLSAVAFKGKTVIGIAAVIISLISLFFVWIAWFFPVILFIVGRVYYMKNNTILTLT